MNSSPVSCRTKGRWGKRIEVDVEKKGAKAKKVSVAAKAKRVGKTAKMTWKKTMKLKVMKAKPKGKPQPKAKNKGKKKTN